MNSPWIARLDDRQRFALILTLAHTYRHSGFEILGLGELPLEDDLGVGGDLEG
jgi:hypothetical protein